MSLKTAEKAIDYIFARTTEDESVEIGFIGGEPLLEFNLIKEITALIQSHKSFNPNRVSISVTTNGTIFNDEIATFLAKNKIVLCVSCDGPPKIQDKTRKFRNGQGTSRIVEENIRKALLVFPLLPVNAVYSTETLEFLPETVDYLSSIGVRNIFLNLDNSSKWTKKHADQLPIIFNSLCEKYLEYYSRGKPKFINLIDNKITVILRGGYNPFERCRMGTGELAFSTTGNLYPCERLLGSDDGVTNCIGNINEGRFPIKTCKPISSQATNEECKECGLSDYCMNWCGCTNYYSTGSYSRVAPFMCAHEKAAINTAYQIIQKMKDGGIDFSHHISGTALVNTVTEKKQLESDIL